MSENARTIDTLLDERRTFAPSAEFKAKARVTDSSLHDAANADPEAFWAEQAKKYVSWYRPFDKVLEWDLPFAKWFLGGELNVSYNCLDRHVEAGKGEKVAYHFEGEGGDTRTITYSELLAGVCRFANALRRLGIKRGDRVGIYMPMIPELPMAMLACARIGAAHSVVFGGFSADAVRDRMNDAAAVAIITADEGWRRGNLVPLKRSVDEACEGSPTVKDVIVVRRTGNEVPMKEGRDHWYHDLVEKRVRYLRAGAHGLRGPALHPLHVRDHRQTQGHQAHDCRLPRSTPCSRTTWCSTSSRTPSTGAPPTSAGSPATPTSCTGRSATV